MMVLLHCFFQCIQLHHALFLSLLFLFNFLLLFLQCLYFHLLQFPLLPLCLLNLPPPPPPDTGPSPASSVQHTSAGASLPPPSSLPQMIHDLSICFSGFSCYDLAFNTDSHGHVISLMGSAFNERVLLDNRSLMDLQQSPSCTTSTPLHFPHLKSILFPSHL